MRLSKRTITTLEHRASDLLKIPLNRLRLEEREGGWLILFVWGSLGLSPTEGVLETLTMLRAFSGIRIEIAAHSGCVFPDDLHPDEYKL